MCVPAVLLLIVTSFLSVTSSPITIPFGLSHGDTSAPTSSVDGNFNNIFPQSFPFFGRRWDNLWVSTNGYVTFDTNFTVYSPTDFPLRFSNAPPTICAYWADVNTNNGGTVYYRQTTDKSVLDIITQEVRDSNCQNFWFDAGWAFVVTWNEVAFYGASTAGRERRNTFQLVLGLDKTENHSFIILNYDRLEWTTGTYTGGSSDTGLGGSPALAGFDAGDRTNFYKLPGSKTGDVLLLNQTSNVGIAGKWILKIDSVVEGEV